MVLSNKGISDAVMIFSFVVEAGIIVKSIFV